MRVRGCVTAPRSVDTFLYFVFVLFFCVCVCFFVIGPHDLASFQRVTNLEIGPPGREETVRFDLHLNNERLKMRGLSVLSGQRPVSLNSEDCKQK